MLRGVLLVALVHGLSACGGSTTAPSGPSPVPQPTPQPTPFQVTGVVLDTANRSVAGAVVEAVTGSQAGTSTTSDARGAFSLTGAFDRATQFRASKEGHVAATRTLTSNGTNSSLNFTLELLAAPANIAGEYTVTFIADSACAGQLPSEVRTRSYAATIAADTSLFRPANTFFIATLHGTTLDAYYHAVEIFVAGDYLDFDLSDNYVMEEVADDAYFAIGGTGNATVGTSGVSTISGSFQGEFDYCVVKSEMDSGYSCVPAEAVAHAECVSNNHRVVLTRR